ncbi:MAG: YraN family protein [Bacteroidetes bacterium]|nr:YraN family protein [Bacteroidota bacterium]
MNPSNHILVGKTGEELAVSFLKEKGYEILHTNLRLEKVEVDIIAKDKNQIVFVEVKTRSSAMVEPEKAVNKSKQKNLQWAAEIFLEERQLKNELRFDIIAIVKQKNNTDIEHFEDAFYPYYNF